MTDRSRTPDGSNDLSAKMQNGWVPSPSGASETNANRSTRTPRWRSNTSSSFVADDEPTCVGNVADLHPNQVTERMRIDHRPSARTEDPPPERPAAAKSEAPPPEVRQRESKGVAGFVNIVASHVEAPPNAKLPFISDADSSVSASFRMLRHRIDQAGHPKIIAVTSPTRKEGKTYCAINLAMAYAEHGREKVLLMEANLRGPRMAATLGFRPPSCFGEQMASHLKSPLSPWNVVAAFFHNLHVVAVDPAASNQWRISAPGLRLAFDQFEGAGYEHIIVDCPSVLGSADVNIIQDMTDGVLLCGVVRQTKSSALKQSVRHLAPANILGVVMLPTRK